MNCVEQNLGCYMPQEPYQNVWNWYKQFSRGPADEDQQLSRNFFRRATPAELVDFKEEFGPVLPQIYERFLLEIGSGYLKEDVNSKITTSRYNEFLSLKEISSIMRKETIDWEIYPDFLDEGEVPFFLEFSNSVFVFSHDTDAVHFPYLQERRYADSFVEFLAKLMADCEFYTQI